MMAVVVLLLVEVQQRKSIFGYIVFVFLLHVGLLCLFSDIDVLSAVSSTVKQQQRERKKVRFSLGAKDDHQTLDQIRITLIHHKLNRTTERE